MAGKASTMPLGSNRQTRSRTGQANTQVVSLLQKSEVVVKPSSVTQQAVTVQQSLQNVQVLLQGCISVLGTMRRMFRQDCYMEKIYHFADANEAPQDHPGPARTFTGFKRGVCDRVDTLIELLENGVADALKRGFLKALHISIFADPEKSSDVLELWTFTFCYLVDQTGTKLVSGINISEKQGGAQITIAQANYALGNFIQDLATICTSLPQLPDKKYLKLEILYNKTRPVNYEAPGFDKPVDEVSEFPNTEDWIMEETPVTRMNTGAHGVSLRVAHLKKQHEGVGDVLSVGLTYTHELQKIDAVEKDLASYMEEPQPKPSRLLTSTAPQSALIVPHQANTSLLLQCKQHALLPSSSHDDDNEDLYLPPSPPPKRTIAALARMSSTDRREKEQLDAMLRSQTMAADSQATQIVGTSAQNPRMTTPPAKNRLIFLPSKVDELDLLRSAQLPMRKDLSRIVEAGTCVEEISLRCECGWQHEEGAMIHCEMCDRYQHLHCYGYYGASKSQTPNIHVCYGCLLNNEPELYGKALILALSRRTLYLLSTRTKLDSSKELAKSLVCSQKEASRIVTALRDVGLLTQMSSRSRHQIVLDRSAAANTEMTRIFFNPIVNISQHLDLSSMTDTEAESASPGQAVSITPSKRSLDHDGTTMQPPPKKLGISTSSMSASLMLSLENVYSPKIGRKR